MNESRWKSLMSVLGLKNSLDCYRAICEAYTEKHRYYHTTEHIDAMLKHFDIVSDLAEQPAELELSIWFHDAIYKPLSSNNELNSAKWAQEFLLEQNYDEEGIERVFNLIMATLHNGEIEGNDEKLVVDIDLAILGTSPESYDEFERNVRKEYKFVPGVIFRKKRKQLLKSFLHNGSIYNIDYFRKKYESAARKNISRAIGML